MWTRVLSSYWCIAIAVAMAVLLAAPSLQAGLVMDDFWHWAILTGRINNAHSGSLVGLFSFADGDPVRTHNFMELGVFPWWTADTLRLAFWRPIAEITHWLDYRWWPTSPLMMHVQNIFWYGLLVALLGKWFRLLDTNKTRSGLAVLLYATCSLHGTTVGWIANRNALIGACFSAVTLILFHRWHHDRRYKDLLFACCALILSLLSSEGAIATMAYLLVYVLTFDNSVRLWQRVIPLLPFFVIVAIWKIFYSHFGYGSWASGVYIDPASESFRFIQVAAIRLPILLLAQLFGISAGLFSYFSQKVLYWCIASAILILFSCVLPATRLWGYPLVRFYTMGMLLALVPVCATSPDDRLLIFSGFGAAGLLSAFFYEVFFQIRENSDRRAKFVKIIVGWLGLVHFIVMPLYLPLSVGALGRIATPLINTPALALPQSEITKSTHIILVNPPIASFVSYMPFVRDWHGLANPHSLIGLAPGTSQMVLSVIDDFTFQLAVPDGFIAPIDNFFREPSLVFNKGDTIDLGALRVNVVDVLSDGRPRVVQFHFADSLHNANWQFYVWKNNGYQALAMPEPGKSIDLPACDLQKIISASG